MNDTVAPESMVIPNFTPLKNTDNKALGIGVIVLREGETPHRLLDDQLVGLR